MVYNTKGYRSAMCSVYDIVISRERGKERRDLSANGPAATVGSFETEIATLDHAYLA
jgi:hypothetical protein